MKTSKTIIEITRKYFNIDEAVFYSKTRKREIAIARQIAMYLSKNNTRDSFENIGVACGNRNHATVMYAIKTVNNLMDINKQIRADVECIQKSINSLYLGDYNITGNEIKEAINNAILKRFTLRINQANVLKHVANVKY